jgi:DNA-binding YbaB/EbfC family protein
MDLAGLGKALGPLQESMRKAASERTTTVLEGRSGGGIVSIRIAGDLTVKGIAIAPAALGDRAMLEDLVAAAVNDALRQHRERFGATPEDQLARVFKSLDPATMMGMLGGLGR